MPVISSAAFYVVRAMLGVCCPTNLRSVRICFRVRSGTSGEKRYALDLEFLHNVNSEVRNPCLSCV